MKRKLAALISVTLATVMTVGMTAFAAPQKMADGGIFDAEFYAATYPDVVAALGTDANVLYQHYVNCGKAEGRLPYAAGTDVSALTASVPQKMADGGLFDPVFYAKTYPEIATLLGTDINVLYNHYLTNGIAAGKLPYAGAPAATPRLVGAYTVPASRRTTGGNYTFYSRTALPDTANVSDSYSGAKYGSYLVQSITVVRHSGYPQFVVQYASQPVSGKRLPSVKLDLLIYNEAGALVETESVRLKNGEQCATDTIWHTLPYGSYYIVITS